MICAKAAYRLRLHPVEFVTILILFPAVQVSHSTTKFSIEEFDDPTANVSCDVVDTPPTFTAHYPCRSERAVGASFSVWGAALRRRVTGSQMAPRHSSH
jgi:hypothetical protein